jgi:hypothetical protein
LELLHTALAGSPTDATLLMSAGSLLLELDQVVKEIFLTRCCCLKSDQQPKMAALYFEKALNAPHGADLASQAL